MPSDAHGLAVTGDAAAIAHYDTALDHLVHFRPAVVDASAAALAESPEFPIARALSGYLGLLGTEAADAVDVRARFGRGPGDTPMNERERAHLHAVAAWSRGDLAGAGRLLQEITWAYPRDLLALVVGHQIDFFTGDARSLRDRIGGALTSWSPADRHWGPVLGMYGFGLEEAGHYARAEDVALAAVEADPKDVWGVHAVVHTYEMTARGADGLRYLDTRADDWAAGNFLNVHNWWHFGLYLLEAGATDRARAVYDAVLHNDTSAGLAMEMLDAAALLWRLYLDGADETARWTTLADAWRPQLAQPYYAFNDAHAVMSLVGAGRFGSAQALITDRARWAAENAGSPTVTNVAMTAEIGLAVMRSFLAFGQERYADTVALLAPIRHRINEFGGSHAQRDAVQRTLLEAALRAGDGPLARTLVSERVNVGPCSPYNWLKQAAYAESVGAQALAADARTRAGDLAGTIARAVPDPLPLPAP